MTSPAMEQSSRASWWPSGDQWQLAATEAAPAHEAAHSAPTPTSIRERRRRGEGSTSREAHPSTTSNNTECSQGKTLTRFFHGKELLTTLEIIMQMLWGIDLYFHLVY